jgi:hypothetical protein
MKKHTYDEVSRIFTSSKDKICYDFTTPPPPLSFQHFKQLTDLHETWYEYYGIEGRSNTQLNNYLNSLTTTPIT